MIFPWIFILHWVLLSTGIISLLRDRLRLIMCFTPGLAGNGKCEFRCLIYLSTLQNELNLRVARFNFNNIDFVNFRALVFWWRELKIATKALKHQPACRRQGFHQTLIDNISGKY